MIATPALVWGAFDRFGRAWIYIDMFMAETGFRATRATTMAWSAIGGFMARLRTICSTGSGDLAWAMTIRIGQDDLDQ